MAMAERSIREKQLFIVLLATCIAPELLSPSSAAAEEEGFLSKISPHVVVSRQSAEQALPVFSLRQAQGVEDNLMANKNSSDPDSKKLAGQNLFSLALGARFQFSDWLGVGAACTVPLAEPETVQSDDLVIEAMVTMQF
ncbi:MAG: hypothetical protein C0613_04925 [Desulfobulbaceae bacterium]|nr:MAG: hypothetical protein C0613_04925 [Desulfobulbaceae bacterium]